MEFKDLSIDEKADYLDLFCWLSAKMNNLDNDQQSVLERTEDEILEHSSENTLKCWKELLLSKLISR